MGGAHDAMSTSCRSELRLTEGWAMIADPQWVVIVVRGAAMGTCFVYRVFRCFSCGRVLSELVLVFTPILVCP